MTFLNSFAKKNCSQIVQKKKYIYICLLYICYHKLICMFICLVTKTFGKIKSRDTLYMLVCKNKNKKRRTKELIFCPNTELIMRNARRLKVGVRCRRVAIRAKWETLREGRSEP